MQLFLSPELIQDGNHILNLINTNDKAVGFVSFTTVEKKMYVYGHLEDEGVCEDFKDILKPYIKGMSKLKEDLEVLSYVSVGGKKIDLEAADEEQSK